MASRDFAGKTVVITGAAGGLGAAMARRWATAGARLGLLDINGKGAKSLADELSAAGTRALGLGCDITKEDECIAAMAAVTVELGPVDVLINNAGITQRSALAETKAEVYRRVMDVNFFGSLHCTQAALDDLRKQQGIIVVISSIAGFAPVLGRTGYCASKHALHGLFDSLRAELFGTGVGVCLVCPSFVDTNIAHSALDGDGSLTSHPQSTTGRVAGPDEVAQKIFSAASKDKRLLVLSPVGIMARVMTRLAPAAYERIMARSLAKELNR